MLKFVLGVALILTTVFYCTNLGERVPRYRWNAPANEQAIKNRYRANYQIWDQLIAATPDKEFVVVHVFHGGDEFPTDYIVHDKTDEIADLWGLHLPYWKRRIENLENSTQTIGPIASLHLGEHYYWIRVHDMNNGYALQKQGAEYTVIKWNCSVHEEPIVRICPNQLVKDASGALSLNHKYQR